MPFEPPFSAVVARGMEPDALVADVRALVGPGGVIDEAMLDAAMRGWSANTRRAFRSDLALWGNGAADCVWSQEPRVRTM